MPPPPPKQANRQKLKKLHRQKLHSKKSNILTPKYTLSNTQIEAIKMYIEVCEHLNIVGLTMYDVLQIIAMHKIEWGEGLATPSLDGVQQITEGWVQMYPDDAIKFIKTRLGAKKKKSNKKKTKKKNYGK